MAEQAGNQPSINQKQLVFFLAVLVVLGIILAVPVIRSRTTSNNKTAGNPVEVNSPGKNNDQFLGGRGETLTAQEDRVYIPETAVADGQLHPFNYYSDQSGKNIYFFVVKAPDGTYRAAANACEVCFDTHKGFSQVGELIRCDNCGTTYTKDQIALEKGGCNPRPIDPDVAVIDDQLVINLADLEAVADLF